MIRSLRPADAFAVGFLRARRGWSELTAETWPKTPPEAREPGFLDLLRHSMLPIPHRRLLGVSSSAQAGSDRVNGFVDARGRAGGLVWDVEYLRADQAGTGVQLMRWVNEQALAARARRLFIETESDGVGAEVARLAGFERYSEGAMWRLDPGFSREAGDSLPARPRLRADEAGLFQLYNATVPANVRVAEAMTNEEWAALYRGPKLWAPKLIGDRQDYVWELGSRVVGWMRVSYGARCQFLELLIHPMYESYGDRMVGNALVQMSSKVPVLADVREYQGAAIAALQHAGFRSGATYAVWVRQLAERVAEPSRSAIRAPVSPSL